MAYFFQTKGLDAGYDGRPVARDIEVAIPKGHILTIIGPNGSGKSTILKTIIRQLKPLGGLVSIGGQSVGDISAREMARRAAVVLTERPKPELMTCAEVVACGRYPYTGMLGVLSREDRQAVDAALRTVNALELKDRDFAHLSDGQLQRIMLARAICQQPEVIVLDEPTSFLDIRYAVEIVDILRRQASERGVTVIMSLHELHYAKRVSDLVMCVKDGRVMRVGTPDEIFTQQVISRLYDLPRGIYEQLFGGL